MGNSILEKAYWKDPRQVLTGLSWFFLGIGFGTLLGVAA
jgi:hypothetical protein